MATTKTIQPTGTTITIPAMTDRPDASVYSTDMDRVTDAVNALNGNLMTQEALTLTAASDVTLASTSKAYKIGKFIVIYAKGVTTRNIINGILFSVSGGRNALSPMTFTIGIGNEWDITSVGYGFVSGNNFLGNVPVNKWFHLYIVYLYA